MSSDKYYLTLGPLPDNPTRKPGWLAVISLGSPQRGDDEVEICTLKVWDSEDEMNREARGWYAKMMEERPWEKRQ